MQLSQAPYAGLILPEAGAFDPELYLQAAESALLAHDPGETGIRRLTRKATVLGRDYGIRISHDEDSDYGPKVTLTIVTRAGVTPCEDKAARLLSDAVLVALNTSPADIVEWCAPDVLLDSEDFLRLRNYVSPQRIADKAGTDEMQMACAFRAALDTAQPDTEAETLPERLAHLRERVTDMEPAELRLGAASIAMTGLIAVVSLPVAAALAVVSFARGLNFRRTTQALSVTALFVGLQQVLGFETLVALMLP